jgi:hypothetical protein
MINFTKTVLIACAAISSMLLHPTEAKSESYSISCSFPVAPGIEAFVTLNPWFGTPQVKNWHDTKLDLPATANLYAVKAINGRVAVSAVVPVHGWFWNYEYTHGFDLWRQGYPQTISEQAILLSGDTDPGELSWVNIPEIGVADWGTCERR